MEFDVVIEIPKGQRNKYEMDHETGRIRLGGTGCCSPLPGTRPTMALSSTRLPTTVTRSTRW